MVTTIENNCLVIRLPLQKPRPSSTGKSFIVASTNGSLQTTTEVNGKPVTLTVSAYIKKD